MTANPPTLIPQPRQFEWREGRFDLDGATTLTLDAGAGDATIFATRGLQQAIRSVTGLDVALIKGGQFDHRAHTIRLTVTERPTEQPHANRSDERAIEAQSYRLTIGADHVEITAQGEAGLFYGVQTLIQLVRIHGRRLPACAIDDRPALPHRGVMLDVSRGKVPTRATLEQLAAVLAHYKLNQLQLYTEHTFRFPTHPHIGADAGSLSADDMIALDAFCRARHIDLVPNLQSTGHMRHILSLPQYQHLAETAWRWSITPSREESYQFLDELYADFLPAFSVPILNVDSDEAWDHGRGQAKDLSAVDGYGRVYLNHILRLRELAAKHGRRIMIWADVLHHHPELIPEIPDDIILLDWEYEAQPSYPSLHALAQAGRPFYVCPGTSSWNTIFPRIDNALANIRNYVRDGIAAGAIGMLNTDWGDMGHYQPLSNSWYSYLFGAEMAWSGAATSTETFDQAFGPLFLGDASGHAVAAIRRLGRAVEQPSLATHNRSDSVYALYEDPLAGRIVQQAPADTLTELIAAGEGAMTAFALLPAATDRHELLFTASQLIYAARKVQLGQTIRATLRELAAQDQASPAGVTRLDGLINDLQQLRAALPPMIAEFERLWLLRAQRSEIRINLDRYARLLQRFDAALAWLREQRESYAATGAIDADLATYDSGEYLVLWDEGRRDLFRLIDLVGRDAVPPEILRWLGLAA